VEVAVLGRYCSAGANKRGARGVEVRESATGGAGGAGARARRDQPGHAPWRR
jgi:hypothetical protein